jgi:hypothetical protein
MATIPRVALLIETSREYGRDVLRGVSRCIGFQHAQLSTANLQVGTTLITNEN